MSSYNISYAVYRNDWLNLSFDLQRDLLLVIVRSQRPVHTATAGMLGNMNLPKVTSIVNNWYRMVQALLNFT